MEQIKSYLLPICYVIVITLISGENVPEPVENFLTCGLGPIITENVKLANYTVPTPVQKWAVPIIHAGRDIMSCAQTGSGKTAAFLMPMLRFVFRRVAQLVFLNKKTS